MPEWAQALVHETRVAHLGLLDESGHPRVQPITFARVGPSLFFAIDDKPKRRTPARIARLQRDPRATVTIDRYDDDWSRLAWVQVLATATIHVAHDEAMAVLRSRYATYAQQAPPGPLVELSPLRILCWRASG